jgi:hypothetical protein
VDGKKLFVIERKQRIAFRRRAAGRANLAEEADDENHCEDGADKNGE